MLSVPAARVTLNYHRFYTSRPDYVSVLGRCSMCFVLCQHLVDFQGLAKVVMMLGENGRFTLLLVLSDMLIAAVEMRLDEHSLNRCVYYLI